MKRWSWKEVLEHIEGHKSEEIDEFERIRKATRRAVLETTRAVRKRDRHLRGQQEVSDAKPHSAVVQTFPNPGRTS